MKLKDLDIWGRDAPEKWICDTADRLARLMMRGALLYLAIYDASPLSRSETEILFLLLVADGERSEPARLADQSRVSRQTMTGLLDRLEAGGYVRRSAHPTDRRRKIVSLTAKGLGIVRSIARKILLRNAKLIATATPDKAAGSMDFFETFFDKLEAWNHAHPL